MLCPLQSLDEAVLCRAVPVLAEQIVAESGAGPFRPQHASHHLSFMHSRALVLLLGLTAFIRAIPSRLHPSYPKPSRRKTARDLDRRMQEWRGSRHAAARRHGKCKAQAADMSATQKLDVSWRQGVFGDAPKSEAVSFLSG